MICIVAYIYNMWNWIMCSLLPAFCTMHIYTYVYYIYIFKYICGRTHTCRRVSNTLNVILVGEFHRVSMQDSKPRPGQCLRGFPGCAVRSWWMTSTTPGPPHGSNGNATESTLRAPHLYLLQTLVSLKHTPHSSLAAKGCCLSPSSGAVLYMVL